MTKTELEVWALEEFWPRYKTLCKTPFVTKWTGGQRGEAVAKVALLNPSTELREKILSAITAQTTHRKKLFELCGSNRQYEVKTKYNKFYSNRDGKTWLHNKGWNDEIPSLSEDKNNIAKEGEQCSCGEPVTVRYLNVCDKCYSNNHTNAKEEILEGLVKAGMEKKQGESVEAYRERCRITLTGGVDVDRFSPLEAYLDFAESRDKREDN